MTDLGIAGMGVVLGWSAAGATNDAPKLVLMAITGVVVVVFSQLAVDAGVGAAVGGVAGGGLTRTGLDVFLRRRLRRETSW